jgi:hypothetical protein
MDNVPSMSQISQNKINLLIQLVPVCTLFKNYLDLKSFSMASGPYKHYYPDFEQENL